MKICTASGEKATSTGTSGAGWGSSSPWPGVPTKKSRRWLSPPGEVTSMNPPAPGPVSGASAAKETSTAATAASTALPPRAQHVGSRRGGERMTGCHDASHEAPEAIRAASERPRRRPRAAIERRGEWHPSNPRWGNSEIFGHGVTGPVIGWQKLSENPQSPLG